MSINKVLSSVSLAVAISFGSVSFAQIPVTDVAQITSNEIASKLEVAELVKQLAEAKKLYDNATQQLGTLQQQVSDFQNEAANMKKRMEGLSNYGNELVSKELQGQLDKLFDSAASVDISGFLDGLGVDKKLVGDDEYFKSAAREAQQYQKLATELAEKDKELKKLKSKSMAADTPQKREEMANVIALEQLEQSNKNEAAKNKVAQQQVEKQAKEEAVRRELIEQQMTLPAWFK